MQKKQAPEIIENKEGEVIEASKTCVKCESSNVSSEKLTKIDNFKDVKICEFLCKQCGFEQRYVDFVEKKNDFGIEILYQVQHSIDAERQVIHSETAKIFIEELGIHLSNTEKPRITTIRGLVERAVQELKEKIDLKEEEKLQAETIIEKAEKLLQGGLFPLTIKIRDPSGNSNVKNLNFPLPDKNIQNCYFERSVEELMTIGFTQEEAEAEVKIAEERKKGIKLNFNKPFEEKDFMHKEPVVFEVPCHTCMMPGEMKLCETSVPYFTDLVIMSFSCEYCGAHSVETKNSGEVHDEALEITLKVDSVADVKRDLFKSDTCKVCIPELELELDYGTLGGQYTTVEGLLEKIYEHLSGRNHFIDLDSEFSVKMAEFLGNLLQMKDGEKPFTLHLIDPLSRSFLQNPFHPLEDHKAKRVVRERNEEEDDFLGFSGMNVDHYN